MADLTTPPPAAPGLRVRVADFEGPLDLLLHLIRTHELSIRDIPIAHITDAYLDFIGELDTVPFGQAGEYLVMAATLLELKSRSLLPAPDPEESLEPEETEDPRQALIRRLLQYQRYRDAARWLDARDRLDRDVFRRPVDLERLRDDAGPAPLLAPELAELLEAWRALVRRRPIRPVHEVTPERLSLRDAVHRIVDVLRQRPRVTFLDLVYDAAETPGRPELIVTFLAVLELARMRVVRLFQSQLSSADLFVERAVLETDEAQLSLDVLPEDP